MPTFHIRLANDDLTFSAGHFLVFPGGQCERLHGHTYRAVAEVWGPLDSTCCVIDFLAAERALKDILGELDHRMLLPTEHPALRVTSRAAEVEATLGDRRWVFPTGDCLLLPIANTTTELLAEHVGRRLVAALSGLSGQPPERLRVEIAESTGASAFCELP